jgi:hypothetical protein
MTTTRKGRKDIENSGYYRALASSDHDEIAFELASILSAVQSKVISNGTMLDGKIIPDPQFNNNIVRCKVKSTSIDPSDCNGHYAHLEVMKEDCCTIKKKCIQVDYTTITDDEVCIYEIKDGDNFDTKKSEGEVESLSKVKDYFQQAESPCHRKQRRHTGGFAIISIGSCSTNFRSSLPESWRMRCRKGFSKL